MSVQTLFDAVGTAPDLTPTPFAIVAECWRCGARSAPIVQQDERDKPHLWAIVALAAHDREHHPETVREAS